MKSNPKIVLALKSTKSIGLDDLCHKRELTSVVKKALNAHSVMRNGGGLKITKKCKIKQAMNDDGKITKKCKIKQAMNDDGNDNKSVASVKSAKTVKSFEKDNHRLKKSVSALQKCNEDDDNNSSISLVKVSSHNQEAMKILMESNPKIVLALKSTKSIGLDLKNILLLDNQLTFDLCCKKEFISAVKKASNALSVMSNGSGLKITKKCKIPRYKVWVWFSKKAITNIIWLIL